MNLAWMGHAARTTAFQAWPQLDTRLGSRYAPCTVAYVCSQCHTRLEGEGENPPHRCTNCGAEAGIEKEKGIPDAMRYFGFVVAGAAVAALSGGIISRIAG